MLMTRCTLKAHSWFGFKFYSLILFIWSQKSPVRAPIYCIQVSVKVAQSESTWPPEIPVLGDTISTDCSEKPDLWNHIYPSLFSPKFIVSWYLLGNTYKIREIIESQTIIFSFQWVSCPIFSKGVTTQISPLIWSIYAVFPNQYMPINH